jgi:hypothetical protein
MNKGMQIEVRFFETAEFHVTPTETWFGTAECPDAKQ